MSWKDSYVRIGDQHGLRTPPFSFLRARKYFGNSGIMEKSDATAALFALSQPARLDIFRALVRAGHCGMLAGELGDRLGLLPNTLSTHLSVLLNARLVARAREGRNIRYTARIEGIRDLVAFLMEDCCQGRPEICTPLIAQRSSLLDDHPMTRDSYNVLFLCTGNSARSLMAEAIMNREGQGKFRAFSAGSVPAATGPHPLAVDLLARLGHDTSALRTKSWDEFAAEGAADLDFVFTVCDGAAAEVCPKWTGQPMSAHWGIPDPVQAEGNEAERRLAFAEAYRTLRNRITTFMNLPIATLDRFALQNRLDEIGQDRHLAEAP